MEKSSRFMLVWWNWQTPGTLAGIMPDTEHLVRKRLSECWLNGEYPFWTTPC